MGVCVSGREGLGTPPAPPAEEALTAEHWGLISLPPPPPISTSLLTSLLLSHLLYLPFSLTLPLFPVVPHILAQFLPPLTRFPFSLFSHFIMSIHLFFFTLSVLSFCLCLFIHCTTYLFLFFFYPRF